jgi:hypothetical protein
MELVDAHIHMQERLRVLLAATVGRAWAGLPGYDRADLDQWLTTVLPLVEGAQRRSVAITEAYLARALERQPLGLNPADIVGAPARAGTPPDVVYTRPFVTVWTALKAGRGFDQAVRDGLVRATSTAETDVQLAMRSTVAQVGEIDKVPGWERVPDANACSLCLIASTQRYRSGDLMPIHNRCGCGVRPLTAEAGHVINRDLYQHLKANGAIDQITSQRQRARLTEATAATPDLTAQIVHHGELGPVLVDAAHDFTVI